MNMIDCTRHRARVTERTCIARQKGIDRYDKGYMGFYGQGCQYEDCRDCETGLRLYQEHKESKMAKEKVCTSCKQSFPRDKDHFDGAPRAKDKLTNECKFCRKTAESEPEKTEVIHQSHTPIKVTVSEALEELEKETAAQMKTCTRCGKEFEATTEFFHRRSGEPDGLNSACKTCRNIAKRPGSTADSRKVFVGFHDHPDLYDTLITTAEEEERTPEQQIRYLVKRSFV